MGEHEVEFNGLHEIFDVFGELRRIRRELVQKAKKEAKEIVEKLKVRSNGTPDLGG